MRKHQAELWKEEQHGKIFHKYNSTRMYPSLRNYPKSTSELCKDIVDIQG
jgi:hypothetical protein